MKCFTSKRTRFVGIVLVFAILTTGIYLQLDSGFRNTTAQEERNALQYADIYNRTGMDATELLDLTESHDKSVLSEKGEQGLLSQGFSTEKIGDAKTILDRICFQLDEILSLVKLPGQEQDKELEAYEDLRSGIDYEKAIPLMLYLEQDFGSLSVVLDEYLCCVQIGVDLQIFISDRDEYEKHKAEKSALHEGEIITAFIIEMKMLERLQSKNNQIEGITDKFQEELVPSPGAERIEIPDTGGIKPPNPTEEIMKEIEGLKTRSMSPVF